MQQRGEVFLGIDVGTTGLKILAMDACGKILGKSMAEYPLSHPKVGWAEQNPADWWRGLCMASKKLLAEKPALKNRIVAIGLSGQMHSLVCLDKSDQVLRPAILWCDGRTTDQCRLIEKRLGREGLLKRLGNPALEGFTLPKVLWLAQKEPKTYNKIASLLIAKDYIRFLLTGEKAAEYSDGAGSLMMNIFKNEWDLESLKKLDVNPDWLPPLFESVAPIGQVTKRAAKESGLPEGVFVVGGGADNACGAVGCGVVDEGQLLVSIGTSGTVVAPTKKPKPDPALKAHAFNHAAEDRWYLMGVILSAGLSLRWIYQQVGLKEKLEAEKRGCDPYDLMTAEAARSMPGAKGVRFLPYLNGERTPHGDPNARGVFFGLSGGTTRGDLVRAVMEGVTFALKESLEVVRAQKVKATRAVVTGGGGKSPFWRQMLADVMGLPVTTVNSGEGPAFGAAILASVGAKAFPNVKTATKALIRETSVVAPNKARQELYLEAFEQYRALYPVLKNCF